MDASPSLNYGSSDPFSGFALHVLEPIESIETIDGAELCWLAISCDTSFDCTMDQLPSFVASVRNSSSFVLVLCSGIFSRTRATHEILILELWDTIRSNQLGLS